MPDRIADRHFHCTDRERAAFEAGIKLGAVYHQFVGCPISLRNVEELEGAIASCLRQQPFVIEADVGIDRDRLGAKADEYDYTSLTGEMLDVRIGVRVREAEARAGIRYEELMDYPLMFVEVLEG